TDPAALAAWFWPMRLAPTAEVDPEAGGRYRIASPPAGMAVSGRFVELEAPRRLVCTWGWEGEDTQTLVTVELAPAGDGTRLDLVHEGFTGERARDDHVQGWTHCLDRLPGWLAAHRD
ncbi:MAG TPA: SRPBCC domain-containing protein, partial [Actinomycetes bacterium]